MYMKSKDIAIVGILLAIGAILRYFLTMLHTPLTPNMIIAFYCLAIILVQPKVYAPTLTTFFTTLASGFTFAAIAIIFVGATILTKYNGNLMSFVVVFVPIVVITAVFNAVIVQVLYIPSSRVLVRGQE
jgi:hypothetical protein